MQGAAGIFIKTLIAHLHQFLTVSTQQWALIALGRREDSTSTWALVLLSLPWLRRFLIMTYLIASGRSVLDCQISEEMNIMMNTWSGLIATQPTVESTIRIHLTHLLKTLTITISNESCIAEFAFLNRPILYQFSSSGYHWLAGSSMVDSTVGCVAIKPLQVFIMMFISSLIWQSSTLLPDAIK